MMMLLFRIYLVAFVMMAAVFPLAAQTHRGGEASSSPKIRIIPPDSLPGSYGGLFGRIPADSTVIRTIKLANEWDIPVQVDELVLKSGRENFRILAPRGSFVISPKRSAELMVEFLSVAEPDAHGLLLHIDSIGIRDNSGVRYYVELRGQTIRPVIEVSDYDYGPIGVGGRSVPREIEIRNVSPIAGSTLRGSFLGRRTDADTAIFRLDPARSYGSFTLEPGEVIRYPIAAHPPGVGEYRDTLVVQSNAMEGDSIGWMRVEGVRGGFAPSGYNWGKRPPGGIYGPNTFTVHNSSIPFVRINGMRLEGADADQFRIINRSVMSGRSLLLGDSFQVEVQFIPTSPGCKEARIVYDLDPEQSDENFSVLQGCADDGVLSADDIAGQDRIRLQAVPNPVAGSSLAVRCRLPGGRGTLDLTDALGRVLRSAAVHGAGDGEEEIIIDIAGIPAGGYFLRLGGAGTMRVEKITIVR